LRNNEARYVSACGKFLKLPAPNVWTLNKKNYPSALIIDSANSLLPVFCGRTDISFDGFTSKLFGIKKVHSVQGLKNETVLLGNALRDIGWEPDENIDYDLMSADKIPAKKNNSAPANLILRKPGMIDLDAVAVLQAGYEREEVLPLGAEFSPAASRLNAANIIANLPIFTAELSGRIVGKINVNAISFTRFQVGGVYVHPNFRRMGIAREMAREFFLSLTAAGRGITLFVKKNNAAARRLYDSLGFSVMGDYRISYY
jgi:ribosomal protein S18 acetylase RimI-like enzyme